MTKMVGNYRSYKLSISHGIGNASIVSQKQEIDSHQRREVYIVKKHARGNPQKQEQDLCSFITSRDPGCTTTTETTAVGNYKLKNYFVPLHVDCSVEYELPKQKKSPVGKRFEPLLMIHPCYFRKIESQHRSPFINNIPNCRHRTAMFVGVALVSQDLNITSTYSSICSLKKAGVRAHQHHYNRRQHYISQYGPISNTNKKNKFQKLHTRKQHTSQHNLSLLLQQTCYPERNVQMLDNSLVPKQSAIDLVNQPNYHLLSHFDSTIQTKNKSNQQDLVKNSSSSTLISEQWDQRTATAIHNLKNLSSASNNNICDRERCTIVSSLKLGKRDAMISGSGEYLNNPLSISNISFRKEMNKTFGKNISISSDLVETKKNGLLSTCLVETTTLPWDTKTNALPSFSTRSKSIDSNSKQFSGRIQYVVTNKTKSTRV